MRISEINRIRGNSFLYSSFFSITNVLIFVNIVSFIIFFILYAILGNNVDKLFALQANNFFSGSIWTLFTSMFMHANFFHLFVNMFSLYFIGRFLEMLVGGRRFFWLYIFGGVFAGFFSVVLSYFFGFGFFEKIFFSPQTYAVGASGALFAVAGVLTLLVPKNRVYLIVGPLIAIILDMIVQTLIPSIANVFDLFITFYVIACFFFMLSYSKFRKLALPLEMPFWSLPLVAIVPLIILGILFPLPIGNMAHLGGFIAGAFYGYYLKCKYKNKTRMLCEYFSR